MTAGRQQQLAAILLALLPADNSLVGNMALLAEFLAAARDAGLKSVAEDDFKATRDALATAGDVVKEKANGRNMSSVTFKCERFNKSSQHHKKFARGDHL